MSIVQTDQSVAVRGTFGGDVPAGSFPRDGFPWVWSHSCFQARSAQGGRRMLACGGPLRGVFSLA
ncbi:MAG: hypothetical protein ACKO3P_12705, partial [Planctomycetaceae bacterium]